MLGKILLGTFKVATVGVEIGLMAAGLYSEEGEDNISFLSERGKIEYYIEKGKWVVYSEKENYRLNKYDDYYVPVFKGAYDSREEAYANAIFGEFIAH